PLHPDTRHITAFTTPLGLFEWTVLPFGLKSAPGIFQRTIQHLFSDLLYHGVLVYLDDIIVYGSTAEEFIERLTEVLKRIWIRDLQPAKSRKEVQALVGFVNYLREFVPHFATVMEPITSLLDTKKTFLWTAKHDETLLCVKKLILYTDASSVGIGAALVQVHKGKERVLSFMSKKLTSQQKRWTVGEQEAWGIVYAVLQCAPILRGRHFTLRTDHRNLVYVQKTPNAKTLRWRLRLEEFSFDIEHVSGSKNILADALSRLRSPTESLRTISQLNPSKGLLTSIKSAQEHLTDSEKSKLKQRTDGLWVNDDGLLCLPESDQDVKKLLLSSSHGGKMRAHHGEEETTSFILGLGVTWKGLRKDVHDHIQECVICQKMRLKQKGIAYSRSTSTKHPFQTVAIDSLGPLPESTSGNKYIIVCIDCFSRFAVLAPTVSTSAKEAASVLLDRVCFMFGTPRCIRTDQGPQYHNALIESLCEGLDIHHHEVMVYNPAANGIVERSNQEVMKILKGFWLEGTFFKDWDTLVPRVQFVMNTHKHRALGTSPHAMIFGEGYIATRISFSVDEEFEMPKFSASSRQAAREYVLELSESLKATKERVKRLHEESTHDTTDEELEDAAIENGSFVWVTPVKKHKKKTDYKLLGPFKVVGHPTPVVYEVENLTTKQIQSFPLHRLRIM
ncbi:Transposon Ty3-I Gag-Pol polyprotein, partial [Aduncisulcus paluster]